MSKSWERAWTASKPRRWCVSVVRTKRTDNFAEPLGGFRRKAVGFAGAAELPFVLRVIEKDAPESQFGRRVILGLVQLVPEHQLFGTFRQIPAFLFTHQAGQIGLGRRRAGR